MAADEPDEQPIGAHPLPTPEEVGAAYDTFGHLYGLILGDSAIHIGMWAPPDGPSTAASLTGLANAAMDRQTDHYVEALGLGPDDHLLDIGCGTGGPAVRLARATGARVTGITVSAEQVSSSQERAREAGLADRVRFALGDAMKLSDDHPDAAYDAAWAIDSFAHMSDRRAALHNAWRVLRPGGRLLLTEFTHRGDPRPEHLAAFRTVWSSPPPRLPAEVLALTERAGFDLLRIENHTGSLQVTGDLMSVLYHDHHEQILRRYGSETVAGMDAMMPVLREFLRDHLGYHVFLLRKPR
ncbi:methyltransferase domain-containing protein [Streptomyces sp. NPDC037389]|uniref:SAM-dependent methyltransferase n=1 Tax=Streptomyces sp. NPDC037389 TaxID=3155369 RepID=UPI0033D08E0C